MNKTYPTDTAREVSLRRPDLASVVADVLTAEPTLTADEVIDVLDAAAAEHAANVQTERNES